MKHFCCYIFFCSFCYVFASPGLGKRRSTEEETRHRGKHKCCQLGTKLAKHGYTECKWSSRLVRNAGRIDDQWRTKSPVTAASPSETLMSLRRLKKCRRFKYTFNRCCEMEKIHNEVYIRNMLIRWRLINKKIQNKISEDTRFNEEMQRSFDV